MKTTLIKLYPLKLLHHTKSEKQVKYFMNELNQKHPSAKFDYKFESKRIEFPDTLVYKDQQNKLQTTIFRKSIDRQNYFNTKSENPYSLKKSVLYSQVLQIRRICSTFQDHHSHSWKLTELFVDKGYKKMFLTANSESWPTRSKITPPPTKNVTINNVWHYE